MIGTKETAQTVESTDKLSDISKQTIKLDKSLHLICILLLVTRDFCHALPVVVVGGVGLLAQ